MQRVRKSLQGPGNDELVAAFLFSEDLFELAQEGRYVNSTKAVTPVTAYRIHIASHVTPVGNKIIVAAGGVAH